MAFKAQLIGGCNNPAMYIVLGRNTANYILVLVGKTFAWWYSMIGYSIVVHGRGVYRARYKGIASFGRVGAAGLVWQGMAKYGRVGAAALVW